MIALSDATDFLALPFAACVVFVGIHAYFGLHILKRNLIFADLALAQFSAFGVTVAFAVGYPPASLGAYAYALAFTAVGALALTASRRLPARISQEAFIGILYVVATAAAILVIDRSPQGAEHVKKMLVGGIATVTGADVLRCAAMYAVMGAFHWLCRRPFQALASAAAHGGARDILWDLLFFLSFGIVVTSSVTVAGVLLVFSFLIIPAVTATMFTQRFGAQLAIAWTTGAVASAVGLVLSFMLDLPTGAALVLCFAAALVVAAVMRPLLFASPPERSRNWRHAVRIVAAGGCALLLASSLWLVVNPDGDQPLLAALEAAAGIGPEPFLSDPEREILRDAEAARGRYRAEGERVNAIERAARSGPPLSDDDIRRLSSYARSFNEMERGEQFVADHLRAEAREIERWYLGLPAALLSLFGLAWLIGRSRRQPS